MANYFVSTARGNDSTGTGTASNPWKTIGKAIGAAPAITPGAGDVLYIEPGTYRETVAIGINPASEFKIVGDIDGAGFLAGGYSTPATGLVNWTAWTTDTGAPPASITVDLNSKNYLTFRTLAVYGGAVANGAVNVGTSHDIKFYRCLFKGSQATASHGNPMIGVTTVDGAASNVTFDKCRLMTAGNYATLIQVAATSSATAEYNFNVLVRDCVFAFGGSGITVSKGGANANYAYGLSVQNCLFFGQGVQAVLVYLNDAHVMAASPANTVYGSRFFGQTMALKAGHTSQITEDGNHICASTARIGVSAGANTVTNQNAPLFAFEDQELVGLPLRHFLAPQSGSWALGWGSYGSPDTVDITGRARPEGGGSTAIAVGPLERHDTGAKDTVYPDGGSGACLKLVGPGSQEIPVLVNAASTTISVKVRWDGNHGDTNKPQVMLLANPEINVSAQTVTAGSAGGSGATPNAYETLTFASITPSAAGVVILRLVSRASAGTGVAYFDTITLS